MTEPTEPTEPTQPAPQAPPAEPAQPPIVASPPPAAPAPTSWTAPEPTPGPAPGVEFAEPGARLVGYIWIFVDKRRRGWFDLIAGTVVVKA